MKIFLALFACGLVSQATVNAVELPLNGNPSAVTLSSQSEEAAKAPGAPLHLNLGGPEDGSDLSLNLPVVSPSSVPQSTVASTLAVNGIPAANWVSTGSVQTLTLDARPKARALSNLGTTMPGSIPADSGVPDSMVYAVLGLLLVAVAWACSGWVNRRSSPRMPELSDERWSKRTARVKMVPLNVGR